MDGTVVHADRNIERFVLEVSEAREGFTHVLTHRMEDEGPGGRFSYVVVWRKHGRLRAHQIDMPGVPLEDVEVDVRANLIGVPRLYVDGASWYWGYAVDACLRELGS